MAAPPAKRQKKLVILSSDEEEEDKITSVAKEPTRKLRSTTTNHSAPRGNASHTLPTRNRTKPVSTSAQIRTDSSLNKPLRKPKSTTKKQTSKPISAFFNSADQAQLLNRQPCRVGNVKAQDVIEDVIEDDSPHEELDNFGGNLNHNEAVVDNRRKAWEEKLPNGSQRFKLAGEAAAAVTVSPATIPKIDSRPWADRYSPNNLEELMVHKRKVLDVRNWLDNVLRGRDCRRLLILRGPSGSGKTATVSSLAHALDFEISEWKNPVGSEYSSEGYLSMSAQFDEFLGRSGKYDRLELSGNPVKTVESSSVVEQGRIGRRKVVLLEEFPNTFSSTSIALRSFRSSVLEFLSVSTPSVGVLRSEKHIDDVTPLIMIITETRLTTTASVGDSFTAHRLLGSDILSHPGVSVIEFNPVASTLLGKALDLVIQKEARHSGRRRVPGPSVLRKLGEVGDIRSAIGSLEFLCLRGDHRDDWGGTVASRKKAGLNAPPAITKMEEQSLEMVTQRESSLGIFHAVGKVVYNKRDNALEPLVQPPIDSSGSARSRVSQVSVNHLINEIGSDTGTFVAALHENYALSCEGPSFLDTVNECLDALSDSDMLESLRGGRFGASGEYGGRSFQGAASDSQRHDEICFQLAVRGMLFALPDPVKRRSHRVAGKNDTYKMFYPTSMRLSRQMEEIDGLLDQWIDRSQAGNLSSIQLATNRTHQFMHPGSRVVKSGSTSAKDYLAKPDDEEAEPFRSNLSCTKAELILERLPYITKIEQRHSTSTQLRELEKITQFHGINELSGEDSEEETVDHPINIIDWSTDRPAGTVSTSFVSTQAGAEQAATAITLPNEEGMEKMFLSDDDIED